jgi:hypothetical protein
MPLFLTIGYGDEDGYQGTPQPVREAAHAHDAALLRAGAVMGLAGTPTQVRNHDDAGTELQDGPFMSSPLPVAGFAMLEADDLADAVRMVEKSPCAVAQGVIEVWPLQQPA